MWSSCSEASGEAVLGDMGMRIEHGWKLAMPVMMVSLLVAWCVMTWMRTSLSDVVSFALRVLNKLELEWFSA